MQDVWEKQRLTFASPRRGSASAARCRCYAQALATRYDPPKTDISQSKTDISQFKTDISHLDTQQLHVIPSLLPAWTPSAIANNFRPGPHCARVLIRSIHSDAHWEHDSRSFLPEGVFFSLVVQLLGRLGAADVRGTCQHLYR
jgi:hypothetical protein